MFTQMCQTIWGVLSVTLLYTIVDQCTDGCVYLCLGIALCNQLIEVFLDGEQHYGLFFTHDVAQDLSRTACQREVLLIDVAGTLFGIVFFRDKGVWGIGKDDIHRSIGMLEQFGLLYGCFKISCNGLMWLDTIRHIGKLTVGQWVVYSKTKSIRTQTDG